MNRMIRVIGLMVLMLVAGVPSAMADDFSVTLNTSSLSGTTQTFVFTLTDGDGAVDNTVTLSDFAFGGGNASGSPDYLGSTGVSGDLGSSVTLDDSSLGTAIFTQQFSAGSSLSFNLATTDLDSGATPDAFAMEICSASLSECYSDDPGGSGAMLILNLTGGTPSPSDFILFGATDQNLPAPVVTAGETGGDGNGGNGGEGGTTTTPEPSTIGLMASGLLVLSFLGVRRKESL